jgi:hypothetical protein
MNYDDLKKIGYRQQPDGSWSRQRRSAMHPNAAKIVAARLSHAVAQPAARQALDTAAQGKGGRPGRIVVRVTRRAARPLDADNYAGGCKPVIDALRYAGLVPDDDPASIDLVFRQETVHGKGQGTQIELIWQ